MTDTSFYEQLRAKLQSWATSKDGRESKWLEYILLLPDLTYLIVALLLDSRVPAKHKAKLGTAIAYIISPLDLLPEGLIGPAGYTDDVALAAFAINQLLNHVDEHVVLKHWKGEGDLLAVVRRVSEVASEMVGGGLWKKVRLLITKQ